jgi:hypothetical protein
MVHGIPFYFLVKPLKCHICKFVREYIEQKVRISSSQAIQCLCLKFPRALRTRLNGRKPTTDLMLAIYHSRNTYHEKTFAWMSSPVVLPTCSGRKRLLPI